MAEILEARVWQKVDTLENWNNNPLILGKGEMALVISPSGIPLNLRWGDGTKRFSDLPNAIAYDQGQFVAITGNILPASDGNLHYSLVGEGTYTRSGQSDVIVPVGKMGIIVDDGSVWSLGSEVDLPVAQADGQVAKGDSNAVSGGEVYESTALKTHGKNYIDYTTLKDGFFVNEFTGGLSANASYKATENFIKIEPETSYKLNNIIRLAYYSQPNESSFISGKVATPTDEVTPVGANYVRVSTNDDFSTIYFGLSSEYDGVKPYEKLLEPDVKAQAITDGLKDEILSETAKLVKTTGKNRINPSDIVEGKYVNAFLGTLVDNVNWKATGFIYVGDLVNYTISPTIRHIAKYAEATAESYITGEEYPSSNTVTRGSEQYVRLSFGISESGLQLESGSTQTPYEPYEEAYKIFTDTDEVIVSTNKNESNNIIIPAPSVVRIAPNIQHNLYFKNAFISDYGYRFVDSFDASCDKGLFMSNQFRINLTSAESAVVSLKGYIDGKVKAQKNITIQAAGESSGSGQTRKVLFLGDSTINQEVIVDHFNDYFDADVMNVNLQGTRATPTGNKHEGRSGWTIDDYYSASEKGGITNPFYNPATYKFDFAYYLSQTSQSMGANDWFIVQLGINDLYGIAFTKDPIEALARVNAMITKLNFIIASVKAVNNNIRIGISMTIPPASQQTATAILLNSALYNKEAYEKIGLKTWWSELLKEFEPRISEGIYLVPSNLFLDTVNNFQTSDLPIDNYNTTLVKTQIDDVHPSSAGYKQMSDLYIGIVKFFG